MSVRTFRANQLNARIEAHARFSEQAVDFFAWVVSHVPWRGGERVLDVGCGTGAYIPYYLRHTHHIIAVDISPEMVEQVQRRFPFVRVSVADGMRLPFTTGQFDIVFANHVLFFVPDIAQALREAHRVLRPGGWFVATTNASTALARLHELHAEALRAIGRRPRPLRHTRFSLETGQPRVASVFGAADVDMLDNAFRFPTVEDALAYYESGEIHNVEGAPLTPQERAQLLQMMRSAIVRIIRREGAFRVAKPAGVILARRQGG